ncbi:hypothetical protein D2L64_07980 [Micromonospora radicis]|uniref:Uncharacterized protein n=1 Tax=Micromonospora radicis TaxID=1894971 RepID=A0A418MYH1_9ACTN|nr:hypothetical protein D2L64_07980 [Micromonospora radicis]
MWASADVLADLGQQVQPQPSRRRRAAVAGPAAFVFTWVPTVLVFVATTLTVPAVTDAASAGTVMIWAAQVAALIAVVAAVTTLRSRDVGADAETDPGAARVALRVGLHALVTAGAAGLVLALQGLSAGQVATLAVLLVVVLQVLPTAVVRLLRRRHPVPARPA